MADQPDEPNKLIDDLESIHKALQEENPEQSDEVPILKDVVTFPAADDGSTEMPVSNQPGLTQDMFSSLLSDAWQDQIPQARKSTPVLADEVRTEIDLLTRQWLESLVERHIDELHKLIRDALANHKSDNNKA
jgi:hypothetical protein